MTTFSPTVSHAVVVDRVVPRSLATDAVFVVGGAAITALLAQIAIPFWPVPLTMQTLGVLLVGASLGPLRGSLSMVLYGVVGMLGVPVFSGATGGPGVVFGATGGYIVGFIAAAATIGYLARRTWDRGWLTAPIAFLTGSVVIYAFGLPWLSLALGGLDLQTTLAYGLVPFVVGDIVKAVFAGLLLPFAWRLVGRRADA